MSFIVYVGNKIKSSPYIMTKIICDYMIPLLMSNVTFSIDKIEHEKNLKIEDIDLPILNDTKSIEFTDTDYELVDVQKEKSMFSFPYISIHKPSMMEVGSKFVTIVIVDFPIFIMKSMYKAPIPTLITLYTVLPTPVWKILITKVPYYLFI